MAKIEYKPGKVLMSERLGRVIVVKDNGLGCVDVRASNGRYYRISGLPLVRMEAV